MDSSLFVNPCYVTSNGSVIFSMSKSWHLEDSRYWLENSWIMYQSIDIFSNKILKSSGELPLRWASIIFSIFAISVMIINFQWFWHSAFNHIKYFVRKILVRKTIVGETPTFLSRPTRGQFSCHMICPDQSENFSAYISTKSRLNSPKLPENYNVRFVSWPQWMHTWPII